MKSSTSPKKASAMPKKRKLVSEEDKPVRIYVDGIYDLFHYGHSRLFRNVKKMFPHVHLIVGVCDDELTLKNKGKTVLNFEERAESVRHCRWVDEVVGHAPWAVDQKFLDEHKIDFVAHDDIPYSTGDSQDVYHYVKSIGKFLPTQRTESISTSDIINRVVKDYDRFVRRNLKRGFSRHEMNVGFLKEKRMKIADKVDEMKTKVSKLRTRVKDKSDEVIDSSKEVLEKWVDNSQKYIDEFLQMFGKEGKVNHFVKEKVNSFEKRLRTISEDGADSAKDSVQKRENEM